MNTITTSKELKQFIKDNLPECSEDVPKNYYYNEGVLFKWALGVLNPLNKVIDTATNYSNTNFVFAIGIEQRSSKAPIVILGPFKNKYYTYEEFTKHIKDIISIYDKITKICDYLNSPLYRVECEQLKELGLKQVSNETFVYTGEADISIEVPHIGSMYANSSYILWVNGEKTYMSRDLNHVLNYIVNGGK